MNTAGGAGDSFTPLDLRTTTPLTDRAQPTLASVSACRKIVELAALAFAEVMFTLTLENENSEEDEDRRILTVLPVRPRIRMRTSGLIWQETDVKRRSDIWKAFRQGTATGRGRGARGRRKRHPS